MPDMPEEPKEEFKIEPDFFTDNPKVDGKKKSSQKPPIGIVALISVLAIVAIISSAKQWVKRLQFPFLVPETGQVAALNINGQSNIGDLINQQASDTDQDGLSDYDELYLYYTSPYLEDSDSDGFSDFEEIQKNYDPNCPQGTVCQASGAPSSNTNTASDFFDQFANLSDEELRQMLISQGMSEAEVNKLDQATLRQVFEDSLSNFKQPDYFADLLENTKIELTPEQIRKMLIAQGMAEADVNQFTDDDLMLIWQQAMSQAQQAANSSGN